MTGLVEDPLFYRIIGQQIGNNAHDEANEIRLNDQVNMAKNAANGLQGNLNIAIQGIISLREQVDSIADNEASLNVALAGVRGVTREILNELRRADPNNPLLDRKVRDAVFDSSYNEQLKRQEGTGWQNRESKYPEYRDAAYGAQNANKGGPEKSQITPNKAVRKAAGVPENHVPDRERFLALIAKLTEELRAHDPNAPILKDKEMVDVLNEFRLTP